MSTKTSNYVSADSFGRKKEAFNAMKTRFFEQWNGGQMRFPLDLSLHVSPEQVKKNIQKFSLNVSDPGWNGNYKLTAADVIMRIFQGTPDSIIASDFVNIRTGIRDREQIPRMDISRCLTQGYSCNWTPQGTATADLLELKVCNFKAETEMCIDTLFDTAFNNISNDYPDLLTGEFPAMIQDIFMLMLTNQLMLEVQQMFVYGSTSYPSGQSLLTCQVPSDCTSLIGEITSGDSIKVTAPVIDETNIVATLKDMVKNQGGYLKKVPLTGKRLIMNTTTEQMFALALMDNYATNPTNRLNEAPDTSNFQGIPIRSFDPEVFPDNTIIMTFASHPQRGYSNIWFLTDAANGFETIETARKAPLEPIIGYRAAWKQGAKVIHPEYVVLASPTV